MNICPVCGARRRERAHLLETQLINGIYEVIFNEEGRERPVPPRSSEAVRESVPVVPGRVEPPMPGSPPGGGSTSGTEVSPPTLDARHDTPKPRPAVSPEEKRTDSVGEENSVE